MKVCVGGGREGVPALYPPLHPPLPRLMAVPHPPHLPSTHPLHPTTAPDHSPLSSCPLQVLNEAFSADIMELMTLPSGERVTEVCRGFGFVRLSPAKPRHVTKPGASLGCLPVSPKGPPVVPRSLLTSSLPPSPLLCPSLPSSRPKRCSSSPSMPAGQTSECAPHQSECGGLRPCSDELVRPIPQRLFRHHSLTLCVTSPFSPNLPCTHRLRLTFLPHFITSSSPCSLSPSAASMWSASASPTA